MRRVLFALLVLVVVGCGPSEEERASRPGLLDEAPAWALFRDGFHLRAPLGVGKGLRWSFVDGTGSRHEGLFARVDGAWQADGSAWPAGTSGIFEIRGETGLLCRRSITLPVEDFEIAPRLSVGPEVCRLAWKLHGRMPLRLTWTLEGRSAVERDVEGGTEDRLVLPADHHGEVAWSLAGCGRVLARGSAVTGPRALLHLPHLYEGVNGLDAQPLVMGEELVTPWSQGYLAAMRLEATANGTRLALRWAWSDAVPATSAGGSRHVRALWSPGGSLVEMLHEDGRILRIDGARRAAFWSRSATAHPGLSPEALLRLEGAHGFVEESGEGVVGQASACSVARVHGDGEETLLFLSQGDYRWMELHRRPGREAPFERVGRWEEGGLVEICSPDEGRLVALVTRPDGRLLLRAFERGLGGWIARQPVDLGVKHGAKVNVRAHCSLIPLPGRNALLLGCGKHIFSAVLLPDGRSVAADHVLPGDATLYVEGLVALSPHRAVALALEPRRTVGFLGEMTRKVSLVEIALEDPLKPVLRTFTIMGDNLRLQAAWNVKGAIGAAGDRLALVLGSELALVDRVAPFTLRHRYQGSMHDDRYFLWAMIVEGRLLCFHKQSGVEGMDLID